ncbi:PAAR domain-containing protein [Pseudomonas cichorii]|nr:PAAR domain-containing protein [Pseudomonas cichorii]MBX8556125.1 PAAR domain-containing protein [Pseudomonas cichorii]MBX8558291.1 PAAR domain-containing protein [Pseudomonas cichorii]
MTPISRLTDQHACPLPLHGLPPIVSASPNVFVNGLPVARVGDKSGCGAVIVSGIPNILINGRPIAHIGSHGGSINTMGGGPVTSKLVIDLSKLGVISDDGEVNEAILNEYPGQQNAGKICPGNIGMELVRTIRTKNQLLAPPKK